MVSIGFNLSLRLRIGGLGGRMTRIVLKNKKYARSSNCSTKDYHKLLLQGICNKERNDKKELNKWVQKKSYL